MEKKKRERRGERRRNMVRRGKRKKTMRGGEIKEGEEWKKKQGVVRKEATR